MSIPLRPPAERGTFHRTPRPFGRTRLGAPLEVFDPDGGAGELLVLAGQHGDEGEGVTVLSAALRSLPAGSLKARVVLAANPDGLARGTRGNAAGVDLNRNWPSRDWSSEVVRHRWTLDAPREVELGPGEAPASEPETAGLGSLIAAAPPRVVVSVHAPLGLVDDPDETPVGAWLAERTGLPRVCDVGYPTPGSFGTWGAEQGMSIVTYELPPEDREALIRRHVPVLAELLARGTDP